MYERIYKLRPEEPQSFLDYATILIKKMKSQRFNSEGQAKSDLEKIFRLLTQVIEVEWDQRFSQVEIFAMMVC